MSSATNIRIGDGLEGYVVRPEGKGPFPGVVVIMEAYGLTGHVRGVCERLAKAGVVALAPDHFHGEIIPYTDAPVAIAKIGTLKDEVLLREVGASLDWLEAQTDVRRGRLGIIGFCMGGRLAFLSNCRHAARLRAAVAFYGGGIAPPGPDRFGRTPPIGAVADMQAPVFLGYGADDSGILPAEHARIAETLSAAKKRYTLAVYPGAGHAFLCEERANYAPVAAELAWRESIDFLTANLTV